MLRKQTKKILVVMLFALTLVLVGRVDANAQTAAPAGVKQVKAGSSSVTVQWNAVMQNDICYYYRVSDDAGFKSNTTRSKRKYNASESYISGLSAGKSYYVQIGTSTTKSSSAPDDTAWSKAIEVVTGAGGIEFCKTDRSRHDIHFAELAGCFRGKLLQTDLLSEWNERKQCIRDCFQKEQCQDHRIKEEQSLSGTYLCRKNKQYRLYRICNFRWLLFKFSSDTY